MRVGFVGLGNQGGPIAERIIGAGHDTTLWARRREALEPFAASGAAIASDVRALGAACEVVGICVRDDKAVTEVVLGDAGLLDGMPAGSVIAIHSTVHPDTCRHIAETARPRGVSVVDAPVSGGAAAARAGRLLVIVGADDDASFRLCRPVFAAFGDPIILVGPVGSAQVAKIVNNALMTAQLALAHDASLLGTTLGLDSDTLLEVLRCGSGRSFALDVYSQRQGLEGFGAAGRALLRKDLDLLLDLLRTSPPREHWITMAAEDALGMMNPTSE